MSLYLHAYYWSRTAPDVWADNVGCLDIESFGVRHFKLPVETHQLVVMAWGGAGEPRQKWVYRVRKNGVATQCRRRDAHGNMRPIPAKPFNCSFDLEPRNRFYIVETDGIVAQRPNGVIIWRWDGERVIDHRKGKAA